MVDKQKSIDVRGMKLSEGCHSVAGFTFSIDADDELLRSLTPLKQPSFTGRMFTKIHKRQ